MSKAVYIAEIVASNGDVTRVGGVYRGKEEALLAIARARRVGGTGMVRKEQWCERCVEIGLDRGLPFMRGYCNLDPGENVLTTAADGVPYRKGGSDE